MKKLKLIALSVFILVALLSFSACDGLCITDGVVIAKIEVGDAGSGLEVYGYSGVEAGYYVVVADAEGNKGIFQAKSKASFDKTSVDGVWEYNALNWYIYAGMTTKMNEAEKEDWRNGGDGNDQNDET